MSLRAGKSSFVGPEGGSESSPLLHPAEVAKSVNPGAKSLTDKGDNPNTRSYMPQKDSNSKEEHSEPDSDSDSDTDPARRIRLCIGPKMCQCTKEIYKPSSKVLYVSPDTLRTRTLNNFPALPTEIQCQIWTHVLNHNRVSAVVRSNYQIQDPVLGSHLRRPCYNRPGVTDPHVTTTKTRHDGWNMTCKQAYEVWEKRSPSWQGRFKPGSDVLFMKFVYMAIGDRHYWGGMDENSICRFAVKHFKLIETQSYNESNAVRLARHVIYFTQLQELILINPIVVIEPGSLSRITNDETAETEGIAGIEETKGRIARERLESFAVMLKKFMDMQDVPKHTRSKWWDNPKILCLSEEEFKYHV